MQKRRGVEGTSPEAKSSTFKVSDFCIFRPFIAPLPATRNFQTHRSPIGFDNESSLQFAHPIFHLRVIVEIAQLGTCPVQGPHVLHLTHPQERRQLDSRFGITPSPLNAKSEPRTKHPRYEASDSCTRKSRRKTARKNINRLSSPLHVRKPLSKKVSDSFAVLGLRIAMRSSSMIRMRT